MGDHYLPAFRKQIKRPHGLILVTGPTGSGKSTTLYASLQEINSVDKNIVTVEDPVEYQLRGINQVQVNPKAGVTFSTGLRSILRQDPDVIMVGEIRDKETATIAIQAALTGHLVFSTLHTNDAPSAISRLTDMGVEPFLIASTICGVIAQRLVRRICPRCVQPYTPPPDLLESLNGNASGGLAEVTFRQGRGCQECRETGYAGRIGIFELLVADDTIRALIVSRAIAREIQVAARRSGFTTLREDGLLKAVRGQTTLQEVLRVTQEIED
jgi:type II secretory ATPase GspE/PulE/Tfp pilus assembly ATPase PilB-like protein